VSTEKQKKARGMIAKTAASQRKKYRKKSRSSHIGVKATVFIGVAIILLGVIYLLNNGNGSTASTGKAGSYPFVVAHPGPGEQAPPIKLSSTNGSNFDLASLRGKTVLLFFQEGLTCQPCWDQIKDMESNISQFQALGIDKIVTITTDSLDALKQKVVDEGLSTPVLSDVSFTVSQAYNANQYGMMDGSRDGHTFIVVGPDGRIRWRADYGGPPDYTMYVPIPSLIADMKEGLNGRSS
jgi:peroxiredoxin